MQYILLTILLSIGMHESEESFFNIYIEDENSRISIEIDAGYLELIKMLSTEKNQTEAIVNYFAEHLEILNSNVTCPITNLEVVNKDNHHIYINGNLDCFNDSPKEIQVKNTCFLQFVPEQINNIFIYQEEKTMRGFKMTNTRKQIEVKL